MKSKKQEGIYCSETMSESTCIPNGRDSVLSRKLDKGIPDLLGVELEENLRAEYYALSVDDNTSN